MEGRRTTPERDCLAGLTPARTMDSQTPVTGTRRFLFQVGKGTVPYPALRDEGSPGGIHDRGYRCTPPVCQRFTKELGVGVEKGDRTVRGRVRAWAGALVQQDDGAEELGRRDPAVDSKASVNTARRGRPSKGFKAWQDLVGQAVTAWVFAARELAKGLEKLLQGDRSIAQRTAQSGEHAHSQSLHECVVKIDLTSAQHQRGVSKTACCQHWIAACERTHSG